MRLINSKPIHLFKDIQLSQQQFGLSRAYCSYGEQLKVCEQQLIFLKRTQRNNIFPPFIENNIKLKQMKSLFPNGSPYFISSYLNRMKKASLKQHINKCYKKIKLLKLNIVTTRQRLQQCSSQDHLARILSIFKENNMDIKTSEKQRLIRKFNWITRPTNSSVNEVGGQLEQVEPIREPPETRVTAIQVALSDNEVELLSLGPNFSLSPRVDEKLLCEVKTNMAACAYQLRWV